jgi:hypothetical protein
MRRNLIGMCSVVATVAVAGSASAATVHVNALGASTGWYADDVRTSAGVYLNGTNSSWQPYFQGALAPSTASDALIAQQLYFTDSGSASGGGSGVMVMDGTSANAGKTSVRYYGDGTGIGTLNSSFTSTFRWYMDPYSTSRTVALNFLLQGTNGTLYSMSYVGEGASMNAWNTFSVDANTTATDTTNYGWRLYSNGAPGGAGTSKSLAGWLGDETWGSILNGATVLGQGFNIGSYQRNCRVGIDWLESSLINGGDRVEFGVIPAPGAIALLGAAGLVGRRRRN